MICENWDPFKKNEREALIKKMVLKRLGDEIRPNSYQKFVFFHARTTFWSTRTSFWSTRTWFCSIRTMFWWGLYWPWGNLTYSNRVGRVGGEG